MPKATQMESNSRFEIFPYDRNVPTIHINSLGKITFNKAAYTVLGSPKAVLLMFDPSKREMAVVGCEASDDRAYPVKKPEKNNAAISAKRFLNHYRIEVEKSTRLTADVSNGMLIAKL